MTVDNTGPSEIRYGSDGVMDFVNGEKLNPSTMGSIVRSHPDIESVLVLCGESIPSQSSQRAKAEYLIRR